MKVTIPVLLSLLVFGCSPSYTYEPDVQTSAPWYVGDRLSTKLVTVNAPVTFTKNTSIICNLSITLDAIVNPVKKSMFSISDVESILQRSKSTISARVVEVITQDPVMNIDSLDNLRERVVDTAQKSFDEIYSKWKYAEEFKVEIVVTSISLSEIIPLSGYSRSW